MLVRNGLIDPSDSDDPLAQDTPLLAAVAGSVQGKTALGKRRGCAPVTLGRDPRARSTPWLDKPLRHHAQLEGFDLHASVSVPSHARDRLEQLLRYCARPAISHDGLRLLEDGRVELTLKTPRFDGTSHLILTSDELIERLVAIIPRPHKNLILYTGVLAPNAKLRARVTSFGRDAISASARVPTTHHAHAAHPRRAASERTSRPHRDNSEWARLMRRAFDLDVLCCPKYSGRMRVLSLIEDPRIARRILRHLGMRDHPPPIAPARMPETSFDDVA